MSRLVLLNKTKLDILIRSSLCNISSSLSNKSYPLSSSLIINQHNNAKLSTTSYMGKLNTNSKKSLLIAQRYLSNEKPTTTTTNKPVNVNASNSELDKPQWERSDRYKIFFGFDYKNEAGDKASAHFMTFLVFFAFIFGPLFFVYYYPDYKTNDWCYREAYLEIARREKAGEPLVSPDYVPSDRIKLPSDEELGDTEIII